MVRKPNTSSKHDARAAALLREQGLRVTPTRLALLRAIGIGRPMTVEQLADAMGATAPNLTTLYRALNEMVRRGIVRRVDLRHGHAHFELNEGADHHHLVCLRCGRVEDFTICTVVALAARVLTKSRSFARVTQHDLELFGLCRPCAVETERATRV